MPTQTFYVASSSDEGTWDGPMGYDTSFHYIGFFMFAGNKCWLRFPNIAIPQGSTINEALIKLTYIGAGTSADTQVSIQGFDQDNPTCPTSASDGNGRSLTSASVSWTPGTWTTNTQYSSPDVKTIVQELVDRTGFSSGNAVMFSFLNNGGTEGRGFCGYEDNSAYKAELYVNWTESSGPAEIEAETTEGFTTKDTFDCWDPYAEISESVSLSSFSDALNTSCNISESFSISALVGGEEDGEVQEGFTTDDSASVYKERYGAVSDTVFLDEDFGLIEIETTINESCISDETYQVDLEPSTPSDSLGLGDAMGASVQIFPSISQSAFIYDRVGWTWNKSAESTAEFADSVEIEVAWGVHEWIEAHESVDSLWRGTEEIETGFGIHGKIRWTWREAVTVTAGFADSNLCDTAWHLEDGLSIVEAVDSQWLGNLDVTDGIACYDVPVWTWNESVSSAMEAADAILSKVAWPLVDRFHMEGISDAKWMGTEEVTDTMFILGQAILIQVFNETADSAFDIADTTTYLHRLISAVTSEIQANDSIEGAWKFNPAVAESMAIAGFASVLLKLSFANEETIQATDTAKWTWNETVQESLEAVDSLTLKWVAIHALTENIELTETALATLLVDKSVSDVLDFATTLAVKQTLYPVINEVLHFGIEVVIDDEVWQCWVVNTNRFDVSVYSNYDFNSYAKYNDRAFGCKQDGLYLLDGDTDDGADIHSGIVMPQTTFGTTRNKRFRKAFFGISGTAPSLLLEDETQGFRVYAIQNDKANVSREQKGKRWVLKLQDFDELDFIELVPVFLTR